MLKNPGFPRVFRISGQFLWSSCLSIPAGAASSCALHRPLASLSVSRQSRLKTSVFPGKAWGFAVEVVGFELGCNDQEVLALHRASRGFSHVSRSRKSLQIRPKTAIQQPSHFCRTVKTIALFAAARYWGAAIAFPRGPKHQGIRCMKLESSLAAFITAITMI